MGGKNLALNRNGCVAYGLRLKIATGVVLSFSRWRSPGIASSRPISTSPFPACTALRDGWQRGSFHAVGLLRDNPEVYSVGRPDPLFELHIGLTSGRGSADVGPRAVAFALSSRCGGIAPDSTRRDRFP